MCSFLPTVDINGHETVCTESQIGCSMDSVIIHYQEIALKKRNRPWFIERLVSNIRIALCDLDIIKVRSLMGRIEVVLGAGADWSEVQRRLQRVFGIANFAQARRVSRDFEELEQSVLEGIPEENVESFRVTARRADKLYSLTSPEIERLLGARIQKERNWSVDLKNPELTVRVEILNRHAFFMLSQYQGPGGLPSGVSGKVLCLISGGIDSPVAAYRLMKRGCRVRFVHFHSYPLQSHASIDKVREITEHLTKYQLSARVYFVAFSDIQRQIVLSVPSPLRVVLYRRFMMRIATRLARKSRCGALVTGEAVGQVASQTLENLGVIGDSVSGLPVLRPLIGLDKDEISSEAIKIGTYPISIIPDQDCCQLFTPRNPATKARLTAIELSLIHI